VSRKVTAVGESSSNTLKGEIPACASLNKPAGEPETLQRVSPRTMFRRARPVSASVFRRSLSVARPVTRPSPATRSRLPASTQTLGSGCVGPDRSQSSAVVKSNIDGLGLPLALPAISGSAYVPLVPNSGRRSSAIRMILHDDAPKLQGRPDKTAADPSGYPLQSCSPTNIKTPTGMCTNSAGGVYHSMGNAIFRKIPWLP